LRQTSPKWPAGIIGERMDGPSHAADGFCRLLHRDFFQIVVRAVMLPPHEKMHVWTRHHDPRHAVNREGEMAAVRKRFGCLFDIKTRL